MKNWKKMLCLALGLALSLSLLAGCSGGTAAPSESVAPSEDVAPSESPAPSEDAAASFTTVKEGELHVSTNAEFPPYEMLDDNGNPIGVDMEMAAAIAEKLGLKLVIDDMGFDAALEAVQNGQCDIVMAALTVNEERQQVMDFTDSYASGVQVVIVKEGSEIKSIDDLEGKMIGTQMGTTGYIYASDTPENGGYGEDHVIGYDNGAAAVLALVNGQIDAVIIDDLPAKEYVAANEGLTILEGTWVEENYAIGLKKGNTELLNAVNTALNELKTDGTLQTIVDKYIKAD